MCCCNMFLIVCQSAISEQLNHDDVQWFVDMLGVSFGGILFEISFSKIQSENLLKEKALWKT